MYRRTSRSSGGGKEAHKMSGMEGGERIGVNCVTGEGAGFNNGSDVGR